MQIQSTTSFNFGARFYPYPNTTNSKVREMFEEKTKDFSQYILRQDDISYFKNDYFQLIDKEKSKVVSHGYFSYTRNKPKTINDIIDRLVEIFEILKNEPLPNMHKDIIWYVEQDFYR